jgi:hypothetical protein
MQRTTCCSVAVKLPWLGAPPVTVHTLPEPPLSLPAVPCLWLQVEVCGSLLPASPIHKTHCAVYRNIPHFTAFPSLLCLALRGEWMSRSTSSWPRPYLALSFKPWQLYFRKKGPRVSLDNVGKIFDLPGIELWPLGHPAHSPLIPLVYFHFPYGPSMCIFMFINLIVPVFMFIQRYKPRVPHIFILVCFQVFHGLKWCSQGLLL